MTTVENGYLARTTSGSHRHNGHSVKRNWWLVKNNSCGSAGQVPMKSINLPKHLVGKKVRFKVEIVDDKEFIKPKKSKFFYL